MEKWARTAMRLMRLKLEMVGVEPSEIEISRCVYQLVGNERLAMG